MVGQTKHNQQVSCCIVVTQEKELRLTKEKIVWTSRSTE